MTVLACLTGTASSLSAQTVEITPFIGYRFGGDFFELVTRQPIDVDGAQVVGIVGDVPVGNGLQVEALFTHQNAHLWVPVSPAGPSSRWQISIDHWQGGALKEFDDGPVRPYLASSFGLTRYGAEGDSEIRFTLGAGGGVKLFPTSHVGVRLNGHVFATFVDADASVFACSPGICFIGFDTDVVWQIEFTAGLTVRLP